MDIYRERSVSEPASTAVRKMRQRQPPCKEGVCERIGRANTLSPLLSHLVIWIWIHREIES